MSTTTDRLINWGNTGMMSEGKALCSNHTTWTGTAQSSLFKRFYNLGELTLHRPVMVTNWLIYKKKKKAN